MNKCLFPWLLAALLPACSSEEPGPRADNGLKTQASFCEAWAKAACNDDAVQSCDSTKELCLSHQSTYCQNLVPVGYSSTNADVCIRAVERAYADAELTADELRVVQRLEAECGQLVDGGRVEGEECTLTTQCNTVTGYICVIKAGAPTGTCQIPETVGGGSACDDAQVICDYGFFCDGSHCIESEFPTDDASDPVVCSYDDECGPEGLCQIEAEDTEGACQPRLATREACSRDAQCQSDFCLLSAAMPQCTSNVVLTGESSLCANF